jgi:hypothetical protein
MSAGELYRMLRIHGDRLLKNPSVVGVMEFYVEADKSENRCRDCGSFHVWRKGIY